MTTWTLGAGVEHQQVGNTWTRAGIVSLSAGGALLVFDPRDGAGPVRLLSVRLACAPRPRAQMAD